MNDEHREGWEDHLGFWRAPIGESMPTLHGEISPRCLHILSYFPRGAFPSCPKPKYLTSPLP